MSGYYRINLGRNVVHEFETGDDADDYIEHHMAMFPGTPVPQREWVGVA
jgi:hypothetical protein